MLVPMLALAALAIIPSVASAAPPAAPNLTPPPPDFLTCKATGGGTICQGSRTISGGPEPNAPVCGSGATAFQIFDTSTLNQRAIRFYDTDGNLTKRIIHDHYRGEWSNPESGAVAPYIQNQNTTDLLAVPGDFATSTQTVTGEIVMRSGAGAPVLVDVGRQVFSDGDLVFSAGQHVFTSDDPAAFDAVCAALAQ
jgi:hypothetical protein